MPTHKVVGVETESTAQVHAPLPNVDPDHPTDEYIAAVQRRNQIMRAISRSTNKDQTLVALASALYAEAKRQYGDRSANHSAPTVIPVAGKQALISRSQELAGKIHLPNGAKFYLDVGSHPEYSTPLELDNRAVGAQVLAGDRFMKRLADGVTSEVIKLPESVAIFVKAGAITGEPGSVHYNVAMDRALPDGDLYQSPVVHAKWLMFLSMLQVVSGTGHAIEDHRNGGEAGVVYEISQRSRYIFESVGTHTTRGRPIHNLRDIPYAPGGSGVSKVARTHIISQDRPRSLAQLQDTVFLIQVFGALLERDRLPRGSFTFETADNNAMVDTFRAVSKDVDLKQRYLDADGKQVGVGEYFSRLMKITDETASYDKTFVEMLGGSTAYEAGRRRFGYALDAINNDPSSLIWYEWVTKRSLVNAKLERGQPIAEVLKFDTMWSSVTTKNPFDMLADRIEQRLPDEVAMRLDPTVADTLLDVPPLGRPSLMWELSNRVELEVGRTCIDWGIGLAQVDDQLHRVDVPPYIPPKLAAKASKGINKRYLRRLEKAGAVIEPVAIQFD